MTAIAGRINQFIVDQLGVSPERAAQIRRDYHDRYGTSLRGLIANYDIDPEGFLEFVHDLPLEEFLTPNPNLDEMLSLIPLRKVIFTNASREHAARVLDLLGVARHFERIADVRDFDTESKPHPHAYHRILQILDAEPDQCIFVEDSARNLAPARELGMLGILVGNQVPEDNHAADIYIEEIMQLEGALHPLLNDSRKPD